MLKKFRFIALTLTSAISLITTSLAATIEIKDGNDLVEKYALLGVAYRCEASKQLSTKERLEMSQIIQHYKNEIRKDGVRADFGIALGAASEKFGITSHPYYTQCATALKK